MDDLYKIFDGGYVAQKVIKKGTLILREKPQFAPDFKGHFVPNPDGTNITKAGWICGPVPSCRQCLEMVMATFNEMNPKDQEQYLKLRCKFENLDRKQLQGIASGLDPSSRLAGEFEILKKNVTSVFPNMPQEKINHLLQVLGIFLTRFTQYGLSINAERFKHSCCANAEMSFVEGVIEFRAVSKILFGEEITSNLNPHKTSMKKMKERKDFLKEIYGFTDCYCDLCEIEGIKGDNDRYDLFENMKIQAAKLYRNRKSSPQLFNTKKGLETWRWEIACFKEMYKYAKECNASRKFIIDVIITPAFETTLAAHLYAEKACRDEKLMLEFQNNGISFLTVNKKLIEIVNGKESSLWRKWNEKPLENMFHEARGHLYNGHFRTDARVTYNQSI